MSITKESELNGMGIVSETVALLNERRNFARPGITIKQLDDFRGQILNDWGAKSEPRLTYEFPGRICERTVATMANKANCLVNPAASHKLIAPASFGYRTLMIQLKSNGLNKR